jgi:hypothetical protein
VTAEGTGVFLTDAGAEISVRAVQHHSSTATTTLEPMYATDLDVMDGVTGELLRKKGERLRGTLRRRGNVFVLSPEPTEPTQDKVVTKAESAASRPTPGVEPDERAPRTARPESEVSETPPPVAQVRRADRPKRSETKPAAPPAAPLPAPRAPASPVERTTAPPVVRATAPPAVPAGAGARRAKPREQAPEQAPVAPPPPPTVESVERRADAAPSQSQAIEALNIVARFLREPPATPPPLRDEPSEPPESAPSQAEAIEAVRAVAQFLLDERSIPLQEAKHAQSIVSRFLAAVRSTG